MFDTEWDWLTLTIDINRSFSSYDETQQNKNELISITIPFIEMWSTV